MQIMSTSLLVVLAVFCTAYAYHSIPSVPLNKADTERVHTSVNICPNNAVGCSAGDTCCSSPGTNGYGCCSTTNAVCCSDGAHCCDQGYTCDLSNRTCVQYVKSSPVKIAKLQSLSEAFPAKTNGTVPCGDGTACHGGRFCCAPVSCCDIDGTCCTGGCCEFTHAVCCSDNTHCCPGGYKCGEPFLCTKP